MPDIVVHCPHCQQEYSIDSSTLGRQFKCVQCQQTFTASAPATTGAVPPPLPATPPITSPTPFTPQTPFPSPGSFTPQPPMMPPAYLGEAPPGQATTSRVALASMICGFLCWIWPVSIAALVLGIIGVGKTRNNQMRGGGMAVTGIVLGALGFVLGPIVGICGLIMVPAVRQARLAANGIVSIANMQQIGMAMSAYEAQNNGALPPDLETLISTQGLSTTLFVYPGGTDTPANSASTLESGGHLSYVYLGGGQTTLLNADRVVLYENGPGHMGRDPNPATARGNVRGLNLLFADGHAEFESKSTADAKIEATREALKLPAAGN